MNDNHDEDNFWGEKSSKSGETKNNKLSENNSQTKSPSQKNYNDGNEKLPSAKAKIMDFTLADDNTKNYASGATGAHEARAHTPNLKKDHFSTVAADVSDFQDKNLRLNSASPKLSINENRSILHHTRSPSFTSESDMENKNFTREHKDNYSDRFDSEAETDAGDSVASGAGSDEDNSADDDDDDENARKKEPSAKNNFASKSGTKLTTKKVKPVTNSKQILSRTNAPAKTTTSNLEHDRKPNSDVAADMEGHFKSTKRQRSAALRDEITFLKKQLTEAKNDNRTLRQIQRRYETALARVDARNANAPNLVDRQKEELRVTREQLRQHKEKHREQERLWREQASRFQHALDKIKRMEEMLKNRGLDTKTGRKIRDDLSTLEEQLEEKDQKIEDLQKKIALLEKNHKHQLNIEVMRHKETQRKLRELEEDYEKKFSRRENFLSTRTYRSNSVRNVDTKTDKSPENARKIDNLTKNGPSAAIVQTSNSTSKKKAPVRKIRSSDSDDENHFSEILPKGKIQHPSSENKRGILDDIFATNSTQDTNKPSDPDTITTMDPQKNFEITRPGEKRRSIENVIFNRSQSIPNSKETDNGNSILHDLLTPKFRDEEIRGTPPPKSNTEFLQDLFGDPIRTDSRGKTTQNKDKSSSSSGIDSGVDHSLEGTPTTANGISQPSKNGKSIFDEELFSKTRGSNAGNGSFPWEAEATKKRASTKLTDDLFT